MAPPGMVTIHSYENYHDWLSSLGGITSEEKDFF